MNGVRYICPLCGAEMRVLGTEPERCSGGRLPLVCNAGGTHPPRVAPVPIAGRRAAA